MTARSQLQFCSLHGRVTRVLPISGQENKHVRAAVADGPLPFRCLVGDVGTAGLGIPAQCESATAVHTVSNNPTGAEP